MKRIVFLFFVNISIFSACYAQLNKFEGTWVKQSTVTYLGEDYERPYMYVWDYYRFDVINGDIQIRHKVHTKRVYLSSEEQTTYTTIKNIKVNSDTIRCDKYFPPEGNTRIKNSIPYETCVEHYECRFTIVGTILYVEEGPLIREFYST